MEIHNWNEWKHMNKRVTELVIPSNCCNGAEWDVLDVSELKCLKSIEIGDNCFKYVEEVKLIGLSQLETVLIGDRCFTQYKNGYDDDSEFRFYVKDCERLRELKIGIWSFYGYSVCEIENNASLEEIEMGDLGVKSYNFYYASLIVKSDSQKEK